MPELPDIENYLAALHPRIIGARITSVSVHNPFLLRTVEPTLSNVEGRKVIALRRLGKRISIGLESELWLVIHLMIAGRLAWRDQTSKKRRPKTLATFEFDSGALLLTEAGSKRRASLHVVQGDDGLAALNPNGLEVLQADHAQFAERLSLRNHTLKRALTDPYLFSGIGNAYSDEILHHAKLSPIAQTQKLDEGEIERLYGSIQTVLGDWVKRLRDETGDKFPEKVTAFRQDMAVHGRFGQPCPECKTQIQRIRYVENELNYCPRCQTGGKVLADRGLSRLLKKDWPRTIEELEAARSKF
ncbi:MAG: formamidopyrimidine-DNA glycosylase [Proteobacteria bacterium]|nr:formamidopyrimidine-DNA glycosylase [Pseudomonadota bacterium]